jgi:hypothetical protein
MCSFPEGKRRPNCEQRPDRIRACIKEEMRGQEGPRTQTERRLAAAEVSTWRREGVSADTADSIIGEISLRSACISHR